MLKQAIAAATVGAAFAVPIVAVAQPAGADTPVQADPNSASGASYRATELLDSNVRNEQGDVIAEIEDFVLDSESNQLQYVILSYGNVAEADAQFYVVPASQFFVQREADVIYLQTPLTVDVIKRAPAFPRAQWVNVVRRPDFFVGVNRFWTGAGIDVNVNRGFGRRGQINAIDVNVLDNPNRPGPGRPGAPGNLNPDRPNRPNPDRPDRPRPDAPGNVNPDRPGADAPGPDRPRGPRPNAPNNPPGAAPANPPGAGPANPPGAGPANPPGGANPPGRGPGNPPGAGAGAGGNAGAGAGAGGAGAGAGAGAGGGVNLPNLPAVPGR